MRILLNGLALSNTHGIGRYTRTLITALARHPETEPAVIVRETQEDLPDSVEQLILSAGWLNRVPLEQFIFPGVVDKFAPDLYLGCDFTLPPRLDCPAAAVVHDMVPFEAPESLSWRARTLYRYFLPRTVNHADFLLCDSRRTERVLCEYFPAAEGKTAVFRPVLEEVFRNPPRDIGPPDFLVQKKLLGHSQMRPYLLYVGSNEARKHLELLEDTILQLHLKHIFEGWLVIAGCDWEMPDKGKGPGTSYRPALDKRWPVRNPGYVDTEKLLSLYEHAELLVHLGHPEGFGYPVAEALAVGTPCIVPEGSAQAELGPAGVIECELRLKSVMEAVAEGIERLPELLQELSDREPVPAPEERAGELLKTAQAMLSTSSSSSGAR